MKIARYKNLKHGYISVCETDPLERMPEYMRISAIIEVEFPERPADETVGAELEAIAAQRQAIVTEFGRQLADIDRRRAELLAITHVPDNVVPIERKA